MQSSISIALLEDADTRLKCIDVGSAGGFHPRIESVRSHADIIGIDADPEECARLNEAAKNGERYINAAVGREGETVELELHRKRKTSSCYKTDMERVCYFYDADRFTEEGTLSFKTRSLDSICQYGGIEGIDYLKIDVEGLELALLAEIEVSFHPFRKDMPLFDEIMKHMRDRGFFLLDLRRTFWSPMRQKDLKNYAAKGVLMFGDALFVLDPFLEANHALLSTPVARARYLSLLCLYGYTAEALMVIDMLSNGKVMPVNEAKKLEEIIKNGGTRHKWKAPVGRMLLFLEKWVQFPVAVRSGLFVNSCYQGDGDLGNHE